MKLTEHFTLEEMTHSDTALKLGMPNEPTAHQIANLTYLCQTILEPMRLIVGPLQVNSGFRTLEVNTRIGGAKGSQHMTGYAADVVPTHSDLGIAFDVVRKSDIPYDQIILEPSWIHISCSYAPRHQALVAHEGEVGMIYEVAQ